MFKLGVGNDLGYLTSYKWYDVILKRSNEGHRITKSIGDRVAGVSYAVYQVPSLYSFVIVAARSSLAKASRPLYLTDVSYFLSLLSFTALSHIMSENRHPRNFHTWCGLVFNRAFTVLISSKCPLKRGRKKTKFASFFMSSRGQLAP